MNLHSVHHSCLSLGVPPHDGGSYYEEPDVEQDDQDDGAMKVQIN